MTGEGLPPAELLQKAGEGDLPRAAAKAVLQLPMEAGVEGLAGRAGRKGWPAPAGTSARRGG